ncbi:type I polyketide synthase [Polyangium aurulentum]|uniref:type I polyketide synthase n=1 Tax=Polyangium aurulentum TaxID=2567896 RepID=UPI0010AEB7FE|nr:type I polyketide synthase [Polyangium aurulentum]UQA61058.1 acyltransferase domain-containing protein [Polyangium aurulentum]
MSSGDRGRENRSGAAPGDSSLSPLQKAILALDAMKAKLDAAEREKSEPIAIIGTACRFPGGGSTPEAFFRLLTAGVDAVKAVPAERWRIDPAPAEAANADPERRALRWGAFLEEDVSRFDAAFFGISPREASCMDPQQRILLEVAWEALERAGQDPSRLAGSNAGVFVGISTEDYASLCIESGLDDIYVVTGNGHCFPAGRLSYALGFQGPSIAVDTACSSSLVAVHLACQSLRRGESSLALAGGVNLMLSSVTTRIFSRTQALSPDGRCKTFDASANGFVRGEGCGLVVLKRLSDAQRDRDPILALIRGSAVNQDGRSTGLTTPNVLAQQAMLQKALENARLSPEDIGYIEAHGTGTSLGDPIEVDALRAVVGKPRADGSACALGALKTNVGHLEAAAGVAGLLKAVLSLQNETIPKNLHFRALNPRISLEGTPFFVPTENVRWPRGTKPRRAGVSSFGLSGTNAHMILEEAPAEEAKTPDERESAHLIPLSAKSPEALLALAQAHAERLSALDHDSLADIAYTASVRRMHHDHRLAVVGRTREELSALLAAFVRGEMRAGAMRGKTSPRPPQVAFVFPGQGSQWLGMGRQLAAEEPVFRAALEACDEVIGREAGFSVLKELEADEARSRLGDIGVVQPLLFALEVALAALWGSWGVTPDCVVGHSMGEVAAAHVAGILTLSDAAKVICRRSRLLRRVSGKGAMALVELTMTEAQESLSGYEDRLGVAVSNGPRSTVLSGDPAALEEVISNLEAKGVFCRRVKVDVASHSPQVDALRADLVEALAEIRPSAGKLPMRSTVTGSLVKGPELDGRYWANNLREPVRFSQVVRSLMEEGHVAFVELSPHPVLSPSLEENLRDTGRDGAAIATLRRHCDERRSMLDALGSLHVRGYAVDWRRIYPGGGRCVALPSYPWQRERYWIEGTPARRSQSAHKEGGHPLLGTGHSSSLEQGVHFWEQWLSLEAIPYLAEHRVQGEAVFPGAGYVEMILAAAAEVYGEGSTLLEELSFERMLVLPAEGELLVQSALVEQDGGRAAVTISSREGSAKTWTRNATGKLRFSPLALAAPPAEPLEDVAKRCTEVAEASEHYARAEEQGLSYGKSFQGILRVQWGPGEVLCRVRLPDVVESKAGGYHVHPALLDACLQAAGWARSSPAERDGTFISGKLSGVRVYARPEREAWVHGQLLDDGGEETPSVRLRVHDGAGRVLIDVGALHIRRLDASKPAGRRAQPAPSFIGALRAAPHGERRELIEAHIAAELGRVLRMDASRVDPRATLSSLGMDSLMGLELRNRLEGSLGLQLSATLLFAHPTILALAEYLFGRLEATGLLEDDVEQARASEEMIPAEAAPTDEDARTDGEVEALIEAKLAALSRYLE